MTEQAKQITPKDPQDLTAEDDAQADESKAEVERQSDGRRVTQRFGGV